MNTMHDSDWLTKEEAEAFIGKNTSFYLEKWERHSNSFLKGWNWAAMFFSIEWMAYRKMYVEAVLYFLGMSTVAILFGLLLSVFGISFDGSILRDICRILMGILGNAIYRKKALRTLQKNIELRDDERILILKNKGGVSVTSVMVCIAIDLAIGFLFVAL